MAGIYNASANGEDQKPGKTNNARLPDSSLFISAGIDPKTGLPIKATIGDPKGFKSENKKLLRIMDEQQAVNSFEWFNLPNGLSGNLIERILYYKGQGMFFYFPEMDQFYFLPYALDGGIDIYGRFERVTPLPFNGGSKADKPWIKDFNRKCVYDIQIDEEFDIKKIEDSCVLLSDYTKQISQTNISRQILNDPLIDLEADLLPFARTALLNSTGVMGMRVGNEDEYSNVAAASRAVNRAALEGEKYVPVVGTLDFQDLTASGSANNIDQFLMAMQSIDNYRLSLHGLDSGGIFQKQAHMLESENSMNAAKASLVMQDKLNQRQEFCDIANSIFGLDMWVEVAQPASGVDADLDGEMYENDPQSVSYDGGNENGSNE